MKLADSVARQIARTQAGRQHRLPCPFMQAGFAPLLTCGPCEKNAAHLMMLNFAAHASRFRVFRGGARLSVGAVAVNARPRLGGTRGGTVSCGKRPVGFLGVKAFLGGPHDASANTMMLFQVVFMEICRIHHRRPICEAHHVCAFCSANFSLERLVRSSDAGCGW
jgi:hypothetical protein